AQRDVGIAALARDAIRLQWACQGRIRDKPTLLTLLVEPKERLGSIDLVLQLQGPFASVVVGAVESGDVLEAARVVRNLTDAIEEIAHVESGLGTVVEESVAGRGAGGDPGWVQPPVDDAIRVIETGLRAIRQRVAGAKARIT